MLFRSALLAAATALVGAGDAATQDGDFTAFLMPVAEETALARSAAPAGVADAADLYLLGREGYERVSIGTNGFVCMVERAWQNPEVRAPICFNPGAVASVLPVRLAEADLASAGVPPSEIAAEVDRGYATGRFAAPGAGAFSYMMSEGQRLGPAGQAFPHVMVYAPYLTNEAAGGHPRGTTLPSVLERDGRPGAILTVGTPEFQPVRPWTGHQAAVDPEARDALLRLLDANETRLRAVVATLAEDEWTRRPDADSWSPAETLEHIAAAEAALLGQVEAALAGDPPAEPFRSSHPDELVRSVLLDRGERFTTVPVMVPNERYGNHLGSLAAFESGRQALRAFVRTLPPEVRDHGFASPVHERPIDGYQMMLVATGHADRHLEQFEEAVARLRTAGHTAAR